MSSYPGRHAALYDLFYADKPYRAEAGFVNDRLRQLSQGPATRLLELACGTGNHALEFERLGYHVTAIDDSPDMLDQARAKAHHKGSRVEFRQEDMRSISAAPGSMDAVVCLFDSLGYVQSNDGVAQVLHGVRRALRPNGLFLFEFWHAGAMLRSFEPLRIRRWKVPGGLVLRLSETSLNTALQLASVNYSIYEFKEDGTYISLEETQTNRFFLVEEMSSYLNSAGLKPLHWFAGFTPQEHIGIDTWHVVAVARAGNA